MTAEINKHAAEKRHQQGWVDEIHSDVNELAVNVAEVNCSDNIIPL